MSNLSPETALSLLQATEINAPNAKTAKDAQRANETAREFEAMFMSEMLKPMFEGLETNEMFGGGKGEEIFSGMLLQEYGKEIAKTDVTGIQTQLKNKLIEMQSEMTAAQAHNPQTSKIPTLELTETLSDTISVKDQ